MCDLQPVSCEVPEICVLLWALTRQSSHWYYSAPTRRQNQRRNINLNCFHKNYQHKNDKSYSTYIHFYFFLLASSLNCLGHVRKLCFSECRSTLTPPRMRRSELSLTRGGHCTELKKCNSRVTLS